MSERIDELIGVIVSWEGWFDWNEAQREVLKDVILNLEKARRVDYLEKKYKVRQVCYLEEHIERLEQHIERLEQQERLYCEVFTSLVELVERCDGDDILIHPHDIYRIMTSQLEALDKKPDDRTVESPHNSWF